jgi:sugar phosphate isomerase/epimerase
LERDPDSSGWFLLGCTTPGEEEWDDWRLTIREALALAESYGVRLEDWNPPLEDDVDVQS